MLTNVQRFASSQQVVDSGKRTKNQKGLGAGGAASVKGSPSHHSLCRIASRLMGLGGFLPPVYLQTSLLCAKADVSLYARCI